MDKIDKIRACYQHCALKFVSGEHMTNQSLRERFNIREKNYPTASRIIADTIAEGLIKDYGSGTKSKKYARYIPFWQTGDIVQGQTDSVRCSVYRKRRGGAMLVFFNRGQEARSMNFTMDWKQLGARAPAVVRDVFPLGWDELVDNPLPVHGDQLTVRLPAEDLKLLTVE